MCMYCEMMARAEAEQSEAQREVELLAEVDELMELVSLELLLAELVGDLLSELLLVEALMMLLASKEELELRAAEREREGEFVGTLNASLPEELVETEPVFSLADLGLTEEELASLGLSESDYEPRPFEEGDLVRSVSGEVPGCPDESVAGLIGKVVNIYDAESVHVLWENGAEWAHGNNELELMVHAGEDEEAYRERRLMELGVVCDEYVGCSACDEMREMVEAEVRALFLAEVEEEGPALQWFELVEVEAVEEPEVITRARVALVEGTSTTMEEDFAFVYTLLADEDVAMELREMYDDESIPGIRHAVVEVMSQRGLLLGEVRNALQEYDYLKSPETQALKAAQARLEEVREAMRVLDDTYEQLGVELLEAEQEALGEVLALQP